MFLNVWLKFLTDLVASLCHKVFWMQYLKKRFDFEKVIFLNIHFFLGIEGYAVEKI